LYQELLAYNQTPERTAAILTDEASAVHKGMLYQEVFPNDTSWYSANAKREAGCLLIMFKLLCEQKDWDIEELELIGAETFKKRMEDLKRGKQE
jgi:hypothetical protein